MCKCRQRSAEYISQSKPFSPQPQRKEAGFESAAATCLWVPPTLQPNTFHTPWVHGHTLLPVLAGNYTQAKEACQQQQSIKRLIQYSVYEHRLTFPPHTLKVEILHNWRTFTYCKNNFASIRPVSCELKLNFQFVELMLLFLQCENPKRWVWKKKQIKQLLSSCKQEENLSELT